MLPGGAYKAKLGFGSVTAGVRLGSTVSFLVRILGVLLLLEPSGLTPEPFDLRSSLPFGSAMGQTAVAPVSAEHWLQCAAQLQHHAPTAAKANFRVQPTFLPVQTVRRVASSVPHSSIIASMVAALALTRARVGSILP